MTEEIYFDMINQKTASLIATSCELGAITTTKTAKDRKATFDFGDNLGMAFQIKDDLFDLLGKESDTGKNSGIDVKKNMMTLPLIFSYSNMTKTENRQLKKLLGVKKKTRKILLDIRGMVDESGGFDYARKKLDDFSNNALNAISFYPDSPVKKSLSDLVAFNALRVK
jgi:octaprenyl-diphosphate synthase